MKLSSQPQMVNSHDLDVLEKFTVMLYDQFRSESNVDSARHTLFTQKNRPYDKIPPTRAALFQHVLRAAYQAGYIWGQALVPHARLPHPNEWGWKKGKMGHCTCMLLRVQPSPMLLYTVSPSQLPDWLLFCVTRVTLSAKRIKQARCLFVCAPGTLLKLSSRDR